jgi:hypothetical protein
MKIMVISIILLIIILLVLIVSQLPLRQPTTLVVGSATPSQPVSVITANPLTNISGSTTAAPSTLPALVDKWTYPAPANKRIAFGPGKSNTIGKINGIDYLFLWLFSRDFNDEVGSSVKTGILIFSLNDPENPKYMAYLETPSGSCGNLTISNNILYVPVDHYLWILDVSDTSRPKEIAKISTFIPNCMAVSGNFAYYYDNQNHPSTINIADISDPAHVQVLGSSEIIQKEMGDSVNILKISGSLLFDLSDYGMSIFDISTPRTLKKIYYLPNNEPGITRIAPGIGRKETVRSHFFDLASSDHYVYLGTSAPGGMLVLDISNPGSSHEVFRLEGQGVGGIYIFKKLALLNVGDTYNGFSLGADVIDLSNPAAPQKLFSLPFKLNNVLGSTENYMYIWSDSDSPNNPSIDIIRVLP